MLSTRTWIRSLFLLLALTLPARATTWIVDIAGGPGSHFSDIPAAIAAAAPGDVILVRGGAYTPFTLSKGLSIIGTPGPYPIGSYVGCCVPAYTLIAPPAGETAVLADLYFNGSVHMLSSAGVVITDRIQASGTLLIDQCSDVRLNRHTGNSTTVKSTHFEIVSSTLHGSSIGLHGGTALSIQGQSNALVARSSCTGGDGYNVPIGLPGDGGNGGYGIAIQAPVPATGQVPTLLLAGGGVSTIRGGNGGFTYFQSDGDDADGLFNYQSAVWRSGCTFIAGSYTGSGAVPVRFVPGPGAFDISVAPIDPTLELVGTPLPGGSVQLNVYGSPGSVVRLAIGRSPLIVPIPGVRVEKLVSHDMVLFLGLMPASGVISQTFPLRSGSAPGTLLLAQAFMNDPLAGESRRTNSVPMIMR
jgi:hypothetical protein